MEWNPREKSRQEWQSGECIFAGFGESSFFHWPMHASSTFIVEGSYNREKKTKTFCYDLETKLTTMRINAQIANIFLVLATDQQSASNNEIHSWFHITMYVRVGGKSLGRRSCVLAFSRSSLPFSCDLMFPLADRALRVTYSRQTAFFKNGNWFS